MPTPNNNAPNRGPRNPMGRGPGPRRNDRRRGGPRPGGRPRVANSQAPDNTPVPEGLTFYCKTCEQIVDFKPTTFNFKYPIENCAKDKSGAPEEKKKELICEIAYGTERSIKQYYKIKDDKFDAERREREERAAKADKF